MKIITSFFLLTAALVINTAYGQEDDEPDFYYEVTKSIKRTGYVSVELDPLLLSFRGSYLSMGVGAGVRASNINEKFSAELRGEFNYVNYSFNKNTLGYRSVDIENKKAINLEASFGYTFKSSKANETRRVRLKKSGNTETIAFMPCDVIRSYIVRVGFLANSFYQRGEAESVSPVGPSAGFSFVHENYEIFQNAYSISVGAVRKISANTVYKTTKFGTIKESGDSELFADVLINIVNKFPQLNRQNYNDPTYPNEITSESIMDYQDQNYVREQFFKLPVGLRLGVRNSFYNKWGFFWGGEIGLYPGSYSTITSAFMAKICLGFKFQHNL